MRIFILLLITTAIFLSCSDTNSDMTTEVVIEKTALEFEDESINTGVKKDTMSNGFFFGMTESQVKKQCEKLVSEKTAGTLDDGRVYYKYISKNFMIYNVFGFEYYDNKLSRIYERVIRNWNEPKTKEKHDYKADVLDDLKKNWGKNPNSKGTQENAKYYWLSGTMRVDYFENDSDVFVTFTNIPLERQLIKAESQKQIRENSKNDSILKDYYSKNKKEETNTIDEESSVIAKLKKQAAKDWPEDYTTQEYWIKKQTEDYHYMNTIPNDDKIKKKAQRDWPLDFSTQKYWYNQQVEAKARLK